MANDLHPVTNRDNVVDTVDFQIVTAPTALDEEGEVRFGHDDEVETGIALLTTDNVLELRVSPGTIRMAEEGGRFGAELPERAESVQVHVMENPSLLGDV